MLHVGKATQSTTDDQRARLEADIEAQQRRVDRVAESLAAVGHSEVLVRKLKDEEAKLLDLRQALAAAVTPKLAPPSVSSRPRR